MKMNHILHCFLAFLLALVIAPMVGIARVFGPPGCDALNIAGTHHDRLVSRTTEEAFATAKLLCRKGTADGQILIGSITAKPLGTVYDSAAIATMIGVRVLGDEVSIMVASGAITVDTNVYTDASGKVTASIQAGCWLVGRALSATTTDGEEIEVATCEPVKMGVGVAVCAVGRTVTALEAMQGFVLTNRGASAAIVIALPAAIPGMRVTAVVGVAQELRLDPNGTETIALPSTGVQSAAGKYITADALTEQVQLVCLTAGTWDVISYTGTWTAEG